MFIKALEDLDIDITDHSNLDLEKAILIVDNAIKEGKTNIHETIFDSINNKEEK